MRAEQMQALLAQRQQAGLLRQLKVLDAVKGSSLSFQGKLFLNFSGNDYLGLSADPAVVAALQQGASDFGVGSTGSPLISGQQKPHQALCDEICDWLNVEAVLLFSSGFAANQAMLLGLCGEDELLLLDKLSHASMIDAALQLPGGYKRFLHNDVVSLQKLLQSQHEAPAVIATEGVFSMDGDSPDLPTLLKLSQQYQAPLLLDDAHGIGVQGAEGAGSLVQAGLATQDAQCLMANFGKALGGQGGFLATTQLVADYLAQSARHFIYSTALSPAMAVAMTQSIRLCRINAWRRERLAENIQYCQELARQYDLPLLPSHSAIQPLLIGDSNKAMVVSEQLRAQGIWLSAIRPPTVPQQQARLRITLTALHQKADLALLFQSLRALL
ncbi:8-amino-7-oxononanoate synthase [Rheinheimera riviphila]|uniref:8-amino-7-oxononanoate synthase n=1 Tax=Rheinheimera riviphila TaxID=1834037 RepID=A0A437R1V0_9GAMM|nr:8-amino-7-oxononanoate synthase [Rheinheimera riviphila]RVU40786.1 8-amino-7-oxononanoate synthase [Rheinheimera riviphila]